MDAKITGLTPLDVAVLLEKSILLNGMLLHGDKEQKTYAKKEWETLEPQIRSYINPDAFELAKRELALDHDNVELQTLNGLI